MNASNKYFIGLVIFMTIAIITFTINDRYEIKIKDVINIAENKYKLLEKKHDKLLKEYNAYKEKAANEDNDKQAIVSYIHSNFKRIPTEIAQSIAENSTELSVKHNVPYELIVGMIEVESSFNPSSVSKKGARGLMQVMPGIWKEKLGLKSEFNLHQIDIGIESGIIVLKTILDEQNGNMDKALYHYVGKSKIYVDNVYKAIDRFTLHKSLM